MRKHMWIVGVVLAIIMIILGGCVAVISDTESSGGATNPPKLIYQVYDEELDENYYLPSKLIYIDKSGEVYGTINLKHWDGDYGLEIMLMDSANYNLYQNDQPFSAWHKSVYSTGKHEFKFVNVTPGYYVIVVDNTNEGWEKTDFDLENDYAVFDLEAYFQAK